jgi:hypothetical protein
VYFFIAAGFTAPNYQRISLLSVYFFIAAGFTAQNYQRISLLLQVSQNKIISVFLFQKLGCQIMMTKKCGGS